MGQWMQMTSRCHLKSNKLQNIAQTLQDHNYYKGNTAEQVRIPHRGKRESGDGILTRIRGRYGNLRGDNGKAIQNSCFICRQYKKKPQNTQWKCETRGMPLCRVDRSNNDAKIGIVRHSCIDEHTQARSGLTSCFEERDDRT